MNQNPPAGEKLAQGLLRLYERAVAERRMAVAERLLCALEELARSDAACAALLNRAYLSIGDGEGVGIETPDARPTGAVTNR